MSPLGRVNLRVLIPREVGARPWRATSRGKFAPPIALRLVARALGRSFIKK